MTCINSKFKTCRVERIKQVINDENSDEIWIKWAIYNFISPKPHK